MALRRIFSNLSLNIKIILMLLLSISALAVVLLITFSTSFSGLVLESSRQRLASEVTFFQLHFLEKQADLSNSAKLLAASPGLIEAIEAGDSNSLRTVLLLQGSSLNVDQIDVIALDGTRLMTLGDEYSDLSSEAEQRLIRSSLAGIDSADMISLGDDDGVLLYSVTPLKNAVGSIIGSLSTSRLIDSQYLEELDFGRPEVHIALIYDGEAVATDLSKPEELEEVDENPDLIDRALAGETWISDSLQYDEDNTPDVLAYAPLTVNAERRAVIAVRNELGALLTFQSEILGSTIVLIFLVALMGVVMGILVLRGSVIRPINKLKIASESMAGGKLDQRVSVQSTDEIGQLGGAFNRMADRVSNLVNLLETSVEDEQAAREQAERSDRVKSAFLASMSHELRTPLNAIINFTRFVIDGDTGPVNEQQTELLSEVVGSGKHLLDLINDVLDMSKIEAGSLNLFIENDVKVDVLLNKALITTRSLIGTKPVVLKTEIDPNLPPIRADQQRILQILLNILSNAAKFTEAGDIQVQASVVNDEIEISVTDTGPGIPFEDQTAVFEPFKQTGTGLRQGNGTGLGMPIARSLAQAHGGKLWFTSQPGQGTSFHVTLPVKSDILVPVG